MISEQEVKIPEILQTSLLVSSYTIGFNADLLREAECDDINAELVVRLTQTWESPRRRHWAVEHENATVTAQG